MAQSVWNTAVSSVQEKTSPVIISLGSVNWVVSLGTSPPVGVQKVSSK